MKLYLDEEIKNLIIDSSNFSKDEKIQLVKRMTKTKTADRRFYKNIGSLKANGSTIDSKIKDLGLDPNSDDLNNFKIDTLLESLSIDIVKERTEKMIKTIKKPSFNIFKSFLRLFNKNLFKEDYDRYLSDLNTYNIKVNALRENTSTLEKETTKEEKPVTKKVEKPVTKKEEKPVEKIIGEKRRVLSEYRVNKEIALQNLKVYYKGEDEELYKKEVMSLKTELPINEHNAELIVLASYNIEELTELKDFINGNPELEHLNKAIDYKIGKLTDETPIEIKLTDGIGQTKVNTQYITQSISQGLIDDLRNMVNNGMSPYEALSTNSITPNIIRSNKMVK